MSTTDFGFCPKCESRKELVMTAEGVLSCHVCGSLRIYKNQKEYEESKNK